MLSFRDVVLTALLGANVANAALATVKSGTAENAMCFAIGEDAAGGAPLVHSGMLGKKSCTEASLPSEYITRKMLGMALISDAAKYQTDTKGDTWYLAEHPHKAFSKAEENQKDAGQADKTDGTEYAVAKAGSYFGKDGEDVGFAGGAHYTNTGTKNIKIRANTFADGVATSSKSVDICITDVTKGETTTAASVGAGSDKVCTGAEREFAPGAYKFSLYGFTGKKWKTPTKTKSEKAMTDWTHMGFREMIKPTSMTNVHAYTVAADTTAVKLDAAGLTAIQGKSIKKLEYCGTDSCVTISMTHKFNSGTLNSDSTKATYADTGTAKIFVHDNHPNKKAGELFIDYMFPLADMPHVKAADGENKMGWFAYDPDVVVKKAAAAGGAATTQAPAAAAEASGASSLSSAFAGAAAVVAGVLLF